MHSEHTASIKKKKKMRIVCLDFFLDILINKPYCHINTKIEYTVIVTVKGKLYMR